MFKRLNLRSTIGIGALFVAAPAFAAGTISGSTVSNTATISYSVGGVAQTPVSNTPTVFTVDRKVVFRLDETAPVATTTVAPGQVNVVTTFTLSNTSNTTMDFGLSVTQPAGGTAPHGGTDTFDVLLPLIYNDTNGNGVYDAGTDLAITYADEVAADTTRTIFVVSTVPVGRATGDVAAVTLTAQARDGGTANVQGAISANTSGANTAGVDTVLADTAYDANNTASDGLGVAKDDYTVQAAALSVVKTITPVSDSFNSAANAKLIPGSVIQYCIIVSNAAGGTATGVSVNDPIPSTLVPVAGSVRINGTATSGVCNANGTAGGSITGQTISSGTLNNVAAGSNVTVYFQATIN